MFGMGGQVGPLTDPQVMAYADKTFSEEFYLDADSKVDMMQREGDKVFIRYQDKSGDMQETLVDYVLAATGRRPNVDNIGIENTTLTLDARGVPLADKFTMQTSVDSIFIAGDASNQIPLLHEAADQARIAGDNAGRFPEIRVGLRRSKISAVFSDPQIGMVGESFREISQRLGTCAVLKPVKCLSKTRDVHALCSATKACCVFTESKEPVASWVQK